MEQEHYFTVGEVAKRLKMSEKFIRTEIGRKRLQANLIGREYRISREALASYEKRTRRGESEDLILAG